MNKNVHGQSVVSRQENLPAIEIDTIEISDKGNFPKIAKDVLYDLQIGGYYRFVTNVRKMNETYSHLENNKKITTINKIIEMHMKKTKLLKS